MQPSELITAFSWNAASERLRDWGATFLPEAKARAQAEDRPLHRVLYRTQQFPSWVQDVLQVEPHALLIQLGTAKICGGIHEEGLGRLASLDLPLENCEDGTIDWFDPANLQWETTQDNLGTPLRVVRKGQDLAPVFQALLSGPSIINVSLPHRVDNRRGTKDRWTLSLRFEQNPSYASLVKDLTPQLSA